jgi:hypothetical protein
MLRTKTPYRPKTADQPRLTKPLGTPPPPVLVAAVGDVVGVGHAGTVRHRAGRCRPHSTTRTGRFQAWVAVPRRRTLVLARCMRSGRTARQDTRSPARPGRPRHGGTSARAAGCGSGAGTGRCCRRPGGVEVAECAGTGRGRGESRRCRPLSSSTHASPSRPDGTGRNRGRAAVCHPRRVRVTAARHTHGLAPRYDTNQPAPNRPTPRGHRTTRRRRSGGSRWTGRFPSRWSRRCGRSR